MNTILLFKQDLDRYPTNTLLTLQRYLGLPVADRNDLLWLLAIHQAQNNHQGTFVKSARIQKATMRSCDNPIEHQKIIKDTVLPESCDSCSRGWIKGKFLANGMNADVHEACKKGTPDCDYVIKEQPNIMYYDNEVNILQKLAGTSYVPHLYDAWVCKERRRGFIIVEKLTEKPATQTTYDELYKKLIVLMKKLHDQHIVYFDWKKANLMFRGDKPVLVDFGSSVDYSHIPDVCVNTDFGKFTFEKAKEQDKVNLKSIFKRAGVYS